MTHLEYYQQFIISIHYKLRNVKVQCTEAEVNVPKESRNSSHEQSYFNFLEKTVEQIYSSSH